MRALLLSSSLLLSWGCVAVEPGQVGGLQRPPPGADFGPMPNVTEDARRHFEATLKDPASAQYRLGRVARGYCNGSVLRGGPVRWYGYAANVYVNAKNSYGGYTGFQGYTLLWNPDATLMGQIEGDGFGSHGRFGMCQWMGGQVEEAGEVMPPAPPVAVPTEMSGAALLPEQDSPSEAEAQSSDLRESLSPEARQFYDCIDGVLSPRTMETASDASVQSAISVCSMTIFGTPG